jgi:hypothetical protein
MNFVHFQVTIVDRDERDEQNLITRRNVAAMREQQQLQFPGGGDEDSENHRNQGGRHYTN